MRPMTARSGTPRMSSTVAAVWRASYRRPSRTFASARRSFHSVQSRRWDGLRPCSSGKTKPWSSQRFPASVRSASCALRCARSRSTSCSGRPTARRPARDLVLDNSGLVRRLCGQYPAALRPQGSGGLRAPVGVLRPVATTADNEAPSRSTPPDLRVPVASRNGALNIKGLGGLRYAVEWIFGLLRKFKDPGLQREALRTPRSLALVELQPHLLEGPQKRPDRDRVTSSKYV
ncbi:hypothetical protein SALBM311S_03021 [Streptomyces alboniger]